ncbi:MAG: thiamine pyrophosphate-dependent enzyme [Cyanobacteriota/Melainabacteria group bacterium]
MESETPATEEAVNDNRAPESAASKPVLFAGAEVRRFKLQDKLVAFVQALNLPVVTSILGKASFPESHPNFIGNYFGQFGNPKVKEYVESSDCIISIGTVLTEMETAGYTAKLPIENLIQATAREVVIGHHSYHGVDLKSVVETLIQKCTAKVKPTMRFEIPSIEEEELVISPDAKQLSVAAMIEDLNGLLNSHYSVVSDVGDCLYAGLSLRTDIFIAPGYYSSMGFGVPAGIGAHLADPDRRPIILVGDGGFQMTGMEMSTAVKLGINPIIIVFNNASYAMLKFIDQQRDYYDLARWDYAGLAKAVGGDGIQATTREEFKKALEIARDSNGLFLIDAVISSEDISPTLKRLTDHFGAKVRAALAS